MKSHGVTIATALASLLSFAPSASAATLNVNGPGQTLQSASDSAAAGDTINVTGSCAENVLIRKGKQRITIDGNTIKNNATHGVEVLTSASANIASNEINSNSSAGVMVGDQATVRLGEQSGNSIFNLPNSTTIGAGQVLNADAGIRCQRKGIALGRICMLNGSAGAKAFGLNLTITVAITGSSDLTWGPVDKVDDGNTVSSNATRFTAAVAGAGASATEVFSLNKEGCRDELS